MVCDVSRDATMKSFVYASFYDMKVKTHTSWFKTVYMQGFSSNSLLFTLPTTLMCCLQWWWCVIIQNGAELNGCMYVVVLFCFAIVMTFLLQVICKLGKGNQCTVKQLFSLLSKTTLWYNILYINTNVNNSHIKKQSSERPITKSQKQKGSQLLMNTIKTQRQEEKIHELQNKVVWDLLPVRCKTMNEKLLNY